MFDGDTNFRYDGRPISDILSEQVPTPPGLSPHDDFMVYVMGPYTAFDATKLYEHGDKLDSPFQDDPLFDPDAHVNKDGDPDMEIALQNVCDELRGRHNCLSSR